MCFTSNPAIAESVRWKQADQIFLDISKPEAKRKVGHVFMLSSEFSVLDNNVNVKVHRDLFTVIRTENKTLSYYRHEIY